MVFVVKYGSVRRQAASSIAYTFSVSYGRGGRSSSLNLALQVSGPDHGHYNPHTHTQTENPRVGPAPGGNSPLAGGGAMGVGKAADFTTLPSRKERMGTGYNLGGCLGSWLLNDFHVANSQVVFRVARCAWNMLPCLVRHCEGLNMASHETCVNVL